MPEEKKNSNVRNAVYAPDEVGNEALRTIETYQHDAGVKTGIGQLDDVMNPMRPGMPIPILGLTSHWKSGLIDLICRNVSETCGEDEIVLYCTWEDAIDEIGIKNLANYTQIPITAMVRGKLEEKQWYKLRQAAIQRGKKPLWLIGHSTQQYRRMQRPTLPQVWEMLEYLIDKQGKKIKLIALDYLQRIRPHSDDYNYRIKIMEIVDLIQDMAIAFNTPVMYGTQASRKCLARKWKMPSMIDAAETSRIEQTASAFLSVYLPHKTEPNGSKIKALGQEFTVTDNLLFLGLLKQKNGKAPSVKAYHIDYSTNELQQIIPEGMPF